MKSTGDSTAGTVAPVPADEAVDALERILASQTFAPSHRSRDFLAYVVTETLAGRAHRLKERTVARRALERSESFDARGDAAVRVQAGRVRAALDRYYSDEGRGDPVRISIPKGTYVPVFGRADQADRESTEAPSATLGPGVVVVQFVNADDGDLTTGLALGLTESLVHELSRFPGIRIIGPVVRDEPDPGRTEERRLGSRLDVQYVLRGTVRQVGEQIRVSVRLSDASTGEVVWSNDFDCDVADCSGFAGQDAIVRQIAGFLGDYSGVVLRKAAGTRPRSGNPIVWSAMLTYYQNLTVNSPDAATNVRGPLLDAVAIEPDNAPLRAMLASTEAFTAIFAVGDEREEAALRAEEHARAALAVDPSSAHAHLVLGTVAMVRGRNNIARHEVEHAIELAPANPSILYGAGWILALAGDWEGGVAWVRESTRLNPTDPPIRYALLAIDRLLADDYASALVDVTRYGELGDFWSPLLRALALHGLGFTHEARAELDEAERREPALRETVAGWSDLPPQVGALLGERIDALKSSQPGV